MVKMEQNMKQNNGFSGIYESAHFANILIEFENDTREMAVDVPESFVAQTKTRPSTRHRVRWVTGKKPEAVAPVSQPCPWAMVTVSIGKAVPCRLIGKLDSFCNP